MLTDRLADLFRGYVVVVVEGLSPERFINLCNHNKIELRNVKRVTYTELRARMTLAGYRKLKKLVEDGKYSLHVKQRGGLPIRILYAKKRVVLIPALVLLLAALLVSSTYVWNVRYTGFDRVNRFAVQDMLENMGLKAGAQMGSINRALAEKAMMENFPDIAWCNIYFKGTQLNVQIVETDPRLPGIQDQGVADIVAAKDGYIVDMRVFAGTPLAAKGQTVHTGQTLISGDVTTKEGAFIMQVAARGEVWAQTAYTGSASKPLTQMVAEKTGRVYNIKYIEMGGTLFPMTPEAIPFETYTAEVKSKTVIGENMPFSFTVYNVEVAETRMVEAPVNEDVLRLELQEAAYNRALAGGVDPKDITKVNAEIKKDATEMQVLVIIEAKEQIALVRQR